MDIFQVLEEVIVLPGVFHPAAYSVAAYADMCLAHLKIPLLHEAIVRNLHDGAWSTFCTASPHTSHRLTGELIRKLALANRLRPFPPQSATPPTDEPGWLSEALDAHAVEPVSGIIASHSAMTGRSLGGQPVASIEKLTGANWWQARGASRRLNRSISDYLAAMSPILRQANSLMVIDQYLDPSVNGYSNFGQLLAPLANRTNAPLIELHRNVKSNHAGTPTPLDATAWRGRFNSLHMLLDGLGLSAEVHFWNTMHDRFIIADVIGVQASAGFDVTSKPFSPALWTRLSRADKDGVQRDFDTAHSAANYRFKIDIGKIP